MLLMDCILLLPYSEDWVLIVVVYLLSSVVAIEMDHLGNSKKRMDFRFCMTLCLLGLIQWGLFQFYSLNMITEIVPLESDVI